MTRRIKLVVAYDGTDFCGWAAQTGRRTVQSTLKEAVRRVSGEDIEIVGASRTDGGAHAKGQVCHFDTDVNIEAGKWARIVNDVLPTDVSVVKSSLAAPDFNSRFCAIDRLYRYRIVSRRDPLRARFAHFEWRTLDLAEMQRAAEPLVGLHDFRAYTEELDKSIDNTKRRLFSIEVSKAGDETWIEISGTAFLRGMMRRIAGGLLEVGSGKRKAEELAELLTSRGRQSLKWPVVLPACGLTLMKIRYGRHPRDHRENSEEDLT